MAKRYTIITLVFLLLTGLASCGNEQKPENSHQFSVAGKEFSMQGCAWIVDEPVTYDVVYDKNEDGSEGVPRYPDMGFFYLLNMKITPSENPYCNPRFLRFELIDVHGNRYFPTKDNAVIDLFEKDSNAHNLSDLPEIESETEAFIVIDAPGYMTGLTLALIYTGQEPEVKLYEVDLKR